MHEKATSQYKNSYQSRKRFPDTFLLSLHTRLKVDHPKTLNTWSVKLIIHGLMWSRYARNSLWSVLRDVSYFLITHWGNNTPIHFRVQYYTECFSYLFHSWGFMFFGEGYVGYFKENACEDSKYRVSPKKVYSSFLGKRWNKCVLKLTSFTVCNAQILLYHLIKFYKYSTYTNHKTTCLVAGVTVGLAKNRHVLILFKCITLAVRARSQVWQGYFLVFITHMKHDLRI